MSFMNSFCIKALVVAVLFAFFICAKASAKDLKLSLAVHSHSLVFSIKNTSSHDVKINKSFSMAPLLGVIESQVLKNGRPLNLEAQINGNRPNSSSYVTLYPGQFYGDSLDIDFFKKLYGLDRGCYSVKISYKDSEASKFDAFRSGISSNVVRFCVRKPR